MSTAMDEGVASRTAVLVCQGRAVADGRLAPDRFSDPTAVVLGASLDDRAWRMTELAGTVVFEVDAPASQADKRERLGELEPVARSVRFVGVDLARDDVTAALAAAGHAVDRPTTWVWEGVVPYLTRADVERSLLALAARSDDPMTGEPFRSMWSPDAMASLLRRHGFALDSDDDLAAIARTFMPEAGAAASLRFGRVAAARC